MHMTTSSNFLLIQSLFFITFPRKIFKINWKLIQPRLNLKLNTKSQMANFSERENKQRRSLSKFKSTFEKWLRIYQNWKRKREYRTKMWSSRTYKKYSRTEKEVSRAVWSRPKNSRRTSFLKKKGIEWVFRYLYKTWNKSLKCKQNTTTTVIKTLSTTWESSLKRCRTDRR
jgi:hypothetical protein